MLIFRCLIQLWNIHYDVFNSAVGRSGEGADGEATGLRPIIFWILGVVINGMGICVISIGRLWHDYGRNH